MPSAQGGWAVPNFSGSVLAQLHANEMVLPANISQGLQAALAGGGFGTGGHTFNMNITAWDARSVIAAGPQIVAAINKAVRNGSPVRVP